MKEKTIPPSRVIGFDSHPDSFTAATIEGSTPVSARVIKTFNKVPMGQLESWAKKHTTPLDTIVLEASGNSFHIVRILESIGRKALVLESYWMGKLKEAHANNDKISAIRIGKAFLAGTAKVVWVPDLKTQERRDWFHAKYRAVKRTTQTNNRIKSYLSDNGVRLQRKSLKTLKNAVSTAKDWTPRQTQVLEGMFMEMEHAQEQRNHWKSLMAQEVLEDPLMLSMVRLCGIRDGVAFALGALIGDINRFATHKKLVAYIGLNPAFDDSGNNKWEGGIGGHGRADLRALLIESAQSILRSKKHPLAIWGRKLMARKGSLKLAVAAIARKLTVAIWYLMKGRWIPFEELDSKISAKIGKIITNVGKQKLKELGKTRKDWRECAFKTLKNGRTYVLYPHRNYIPKPEADPGPRRTTLAQEYGIE